MKLNIHYLAMLKKGKKYVYIIEGEGLDNIIYQIQFPIIEWKAFNIIILEIVFIDHIKVVLKQI